jgi:hypothetical protein
VNAVDTRWHDVLFATRLLRKSPVFTAAIVLTLAFGVGVNTAVFSVVNAIILGPLPIRDSDSLVVIGPTHRWCVRALTPGPLDNACLGELCLNLRDEQL